MVTSAARAPLPMVPCREPSNLNLMNHVHDQSNMHILRLKLRGFIPKLAKRLTRKKKIRYGLSSEGVVRKGVDKRGRQVVSLGWNAVATCVAPENMLCCTDELS